MTFPEQFDFALRNFSESNVPNLSSYEYWGAELRDLWWYKGTVKYRFQFEQPRKNKIRVTFHKDKFKLFPKFFNWLHNEIPMFPYLAKCSYEELKGLDLDLTEKRYYEILVKLYSVAA